jgi:DNA-binding response OmpR family regulator
MEPKILCVEGKYAGTPFFASQLESKGYKVTKTKTGKEALAALTSVKPHLVVVNAPSMRTNGLRICQSLREKKPKLPIILICEEKIEISSESVAANVVLALPFTVRKLNNRIRDLLPLKSNKNLKAGDIKLDLENNQAHCQGRSVHLTPRLSCLLEILMRRVGEVVERDELFREVWDTDFIDDTRTLDVHISWLRKAIEKDPRKPVFIKTLRGVGYRLDV